MSETTETTGLTNGTDAISDAGDNQEGLNNEPALDEGTPEGQDNNGTPEGQPETQTIDNGFYGAPESYDFSKIDYPEGIRMDEALAKEFAPLGKELNLSQQGANKLAELLIKYQQAQLADAPNKIAEFKKQEAAQTKLAYEKMLNEDKEIGGGDTSKMNAYIDVADVGYNSFASGELKNLLHSLSLDFHPAVIKHFYRLGKLCGNDNLTKVKSPVTEGLTPAQILYGSTTKTSD